MNRQDFLRSLGMSALGVTLGGALISSCAGKPSSEQQTAQDSLVNEPQKPKDLFFKISLAEWSLHKALFAKELDNLDFPAKAKNDFGISGVEYVNQFFKDKAQDEKYLAELKKRCDDNGVTSVLIMIDGEGELAEVDAKKRLKSVENHYKWVDAAKYLGCHSIRVNCFGIGTEEEVSKAGIEGLRKLSEYAQKDNIGIIVENHGGYSSNGQWLSNVIKSVGLPNCGTLPDFGNFCIKRKDGKQWEGPCVEEYDRYKGVEEMMPYAKGVSAKVYDLDAQGNCVETDYNKIMSVVKNAGYNGWVGIEYEGDKLSEPDGIKATKALLERVGATLS
jgi:sugar phosphate isomerase/epimerase